MLAEPAFSCHNCQKTLLDFVTRLLILFAELLNNGHRSTKQKILILHFEEETNSDIDE